MTSPTRRPRLSRRSCVLDDREVGAGLIDPAQGEGVFVWYDTRCVRGWLLDRLRNARQANPVDSGRRGVAAAYSGGRTTTQFRPLLSF